ncbi:MAG: TIGR02281 family clan AA aspartic protease [Sphingomonas sp.]|uniref:retropepsin-like aspartic protease family protein n=1 Tax=Sphingomonas sp. TaxID=28214 RepID=UPI001AC4763F|nr:TIGR02281 family clan AA aspartic protease [Sphingomonas sp.]MBN8807400.1 TIGR02281 family clan AA aspartic protease [Sphingomonas sp.]
MNDQTENAIFYVMLLVLPLSALLARRLPIGRIGVMAAAWIGIFAIGLGVIALVNRNDWLVSGAHELFFGRDQSVVGGEVRVPIAEDGHFYVRAGINGVERSLMVDSGASYTSLSTDTAAAAKVAVDASGPPLVLDTANGMVTAQPARIATLTIGSITARDAPAAVASEFGNTDVLGMSFLSKLKSWRVEGGTLILTPNPQ